MMLVPPVIRLLLQIAARGREADYSQAGLTRPVTVRHARNRKPVRGEKPAISIILVSDEVQPSDSDRNAFEQVREMTIDIQVDIDLETEESALDETGLAELFMVSAIFVEALRDEQPNSWLGGMCDWIQVGAYEPDDRSTPDDGRMTRALSVIYRTRSDDPNVLLAAGADA